MKIKSFFALCLLAPVSLWGVYAPLPESQLGDAFVIDIMAGVGFDSNITGAPDGTVETVPDPLVSVPPTVELEAEDSYFWRVAPGVTFNSNITDQTLLSLYYELDARFYDDRGDSGTEDSLYNHAFGASIDHAFSDRLTLAVSDDYRIIDDPETSINGLIQQGDQSYDANEFNASLLVEVTERDGIAVKYQNSDYEYDEGVVADQLDRNENVIGLEYRRQLRPTTVAVAELRYQDIGYDEETFIGGPLGSLDKDSDSIFYLIGLDHNFSSRFSVSSRIGIEDRDREVGDGETNGYANILARYLYAEQSFIAAGLTYSIRETSSNVYFTDEEVLGLQFRVQHEITSRIIGSGHLTYDIGELQGRDGAGFGFPDVDDVDEDTVRVGLALTYLVNDQFSVIASYDYDDVSSDYELREYDRHRFGLMGRYSFGLGWPFN